MIGPGPLPSWLPAAAGRVVGGIYGIVSIAVPLHYASGRPRCCPAVLLIVTGAGYSLIIAAMALVEADPVGPGRLPAACHDPRHLRTAGAGRTRLVRRPGPGVPGQ